MQQCLHLHQFADLAVLPLSDYEFTISLRVRHPGIDPALITEQLGVEPQHTWRAGEARRDVAGDQLKGVYRESYWMGKLMAQPQLSSESASLESVLRQLSERLRRAQELLGRLNAEGGVSELHVSVFARGDFRLELSAQLVAALSRYGLGVTLEVNVQPASPPVAAPQA
jgi:hypothetical protein